MTPEAIVMSGPVRPLRAVSGYMIVWLPGSALMSMACVIIKGYEDFHGLGCCQKPCTCLRATALNWLHPSAATVASHHFVATLNTLTINKFNSNASVMLLSLLSWETDISPLCRLPYVQKYLDRVVYFAGLSLVPVY